MPGVVFEILLVFVLLVANGVFALSEIAVVSSRRARLHQLAEAGNEGAKRALELASSPEEFLSTVQIGITLVGIFTGAFSGATLSQPLARWLDNFPPLAPYAGPLAFGIVVVLTTYFSLIIGELAPKRIALNDPERIAARVAAPMYRLSRLTAPLVTLLSRSTELVTRVLGIQEREETPVTEEELRLLLRQGTAAGVFEEAEQTMVDRVFLLMDRRVGPLSVPRREMVWLDITADPETIRRRILEERHTRLIVCERGPDHVVGVVHTRDLLAQALEGRPLSLEEVLQPALFVPESARAVHLLEQFRAHRTHIAVAIDEHGGTHGVITLTDLLEAIVGEMPGEGPETEPMVARRQDGSWLLDGALPIEDLKALLDLKDLPEEQQADYSTLSGLMSTRLGRIPGAGDAFEWDGFRFEVVDMDGLHVDKVLVSAAGEE
ncbi:MAG: hemolysin family protein [Armatimonadota bacterium]